MSTPSPSPVLKRLCSGLLLTGGLLWSHGAMAQIAIVQEAPTETPRQNTPQIISQDDCETTSLDLTATGLNPSEVVSVWVSETADCALASQRAEGGLCFDTGLTFEGSADVNTTATLSYRDLLEAFPEVQECRDGTGVADGRSLSVYLLVDVDAADATNVAVLSRINAFDLVGPPPISITAASPAEDALVLSFDGMLDPGATGFQVFAEPADGSCTAPSLTAGEVPPSALAVAQGSAVRDLEVGLEADVRFAVGVASLDPVGNRGPLSPLVCATPLGFAALSSNSGGCRVAEAGSEAPGGWWLVPLGLLMIRRRRSPGVS